MLAYIICKIIFIHYLSIFNLFFYCFIFDINIFYFVTLNISKYLYYFTFISLFLLTD